VLAVLEELLSHVRARLAAADKGVRLRAAQLLQQLLGGLPSELLLDAAVLSELAAALAERLQDKHIAVRAEATRAVCQLITDAAAADVSCCWVAEAAAAA
jgi:hypothetical protein